MVIRFFVFDNILADTSVEFELQSQMAFDESSKYIRPSKKASCTFKECSNLCGKKDGVVVSIGDTHFAFCELSHFQSEIQSIDIKQLLQNPFEREVVKGSKLSKDIKCTRSLCGNKCPKILGVHGNVTLLNFGSQLFFCSIKCLLDTMRLMKAGAWKTIRKKQEA